MDPSLKDRFIRTPNAFEVLGIPASASDRDIKQAYKELALVYHPDKNKDPDAARYFLKVKEAYHLLTDPDVTAQYRTFWDTKQSADRQVEQERVQRQRMETDLLKREEEARLRKAMEQGDRFRHRPAERRPQYVDDPELAEKLKQPINIDRAYYTLRFNWKNPELVVDSGVMHAMFEAFGEVEEVTVDAKAAAGQVEFRKLAHCEAALAYFREVGGDFGVEFGVKHKRETNLEKMGRTRVEDIKLSSGSIFGFLQNRDKKNTQKSNANA
jgi:hypothetical protein